MSKEIADGIRNNSGMWQHGHTYQVHSFILVITPLIDYQ
jgi:hypothetical protein